MLHLIEKAENNHDLTREELILLLEDTGCSEELFAAADRERTGGTLFRGSKYRGKRE